MALVFGVGAGLFSLVIVWLLGIFGCLVLSRSSSNGKGSVFLVTILLLVVTIVLVFYPRKSLDEELLQDSQDDKDVDRLAIPRLVLFAFMCLFAVVALMLLLLTHWMEPVYTPAVVAKRTYTF